jgi:dynein heavy chain
LWSQHYVAQVAHGDLTEAPLETLSAVAQHVFLPLLTTSSNQEGWPDVVAKEVSENLHRFVANGEQSNHNM